MVETGYRQLIVLRHAKTEAFASSDRARKLTDRGRADAAAAGRWLQANSAIPTLVLTSPAARALATAEIVVEQLESECELRVVEELYGAGTYDVVELVREVDPETSSVLVVGHNPTMEDLAFGLDGSPAHEWSDHLPTAGIVVFTVERPWRELEVRSATLTARHAPRG